MSITLINTNAPINKCEILTCNLRCMPCYICFSCSHLLKIRGYLHVDSDVRNCIICNKEEIDRSYYICSNHWDDFKEIVKNEIERTNIIKQNDDE